jgi:hypothetical protein
LLINALWPSSDRSGGWFVQLRWTERPRDEPILLPSREAATAALWGRADSERGAAFPRLARRPAHQAKATPRRGSQRPGGSSGDRGARATRESGAQGLPATPLQAKLPVSETMARSTRGYGPAVNLPDKVRGPVGIAGPGRCTALPVASWLFLSRSHAHALVLIVVKGYGPARGSILHGIHQRGKSPR